MTTKLFVPVYCGLIFLAACAPPGPVVPHDPDRITQVSIINALMVGRYDGVMPIPEMLRHGDFGIGTLDHLDGELIVLDGLAYQARGDGVVAEVGPDRSTPFAVITPFDPDGGFPCPEVASLADLDARLDEALPRNDHFVAIRVHGRFASITLRSVRRQEPPYRPLAEVAQGQSVWERVDIDGTLVGVRSPAWVVGLNVPGYHWHFLSDDRKVGGHVLDLQVRDGRVLYDDCRDWLVKLDGSAGSELIAPGRDLGEDLRRVESPRGGTGAHGR